MEEDKPPTREVSVVLIPAGLFLSLTKYLSEQPYKDVSDILNVLLSYKAQMVNVLEEKE